MTYANMKGTEARSECDSYEIWMVHSGPPTDTTVTSCSSANIITKLAGN